MEAAANSNRWFCLLSGLSCVAGVVMLGLSFAINSGPPPDPSSAELIRFGQQHFSNILWGAWLQAVGPVLIVLFAFALVHLAGAAQRLSGWMTFFGATLLMMVSLIEVTLYIGALNPEPPSLPSIALRLIYAVQHLYFVVAAPSLFLPLGIVLLRSRVLPQIFGYLGLVLAAAFAALGVAYMMTMILPVWVTAFAGVQALWWLAAAITLMARGGKTLQEVTVH
jgi:hypothetical protein